MDGDCTGGVVVSRDWLHTKILDAAQKKHHGKLCGLVLAGGTGAGKVGAVELSSSFTMLFGECVFIGGCFIRL